MLRPADVEQEDVEAVLRAQLVGEVHEGGGGRLGDPVVDDQLRLPAWPPTIGGGRCCFGLPARRSNGVISDSFTSTGFIMLLCYFTCWNKGQKWQLHVC